MERISDDMVELLIHYVKHHQGTLAQRDAVVSALVELRERRAAEKAPCPEHAKIVEDWEHLCPICGWHHNIGNPCYSKI